MLSSTDEVERLPHNPLNLTDVFATVQDDPYTDQIPDVGDIGGFVLVLGAAIPQFLLQRRRLFHPRLA